ncbi:LOW QUALITY PROTEIN: hypothetical protein MC885_016801, partial [Smutsia gigantea]
MCSFLIRPPPSLDFLTLQGGGMELGNFQVHLSISSVCFLFLNKPWESNFVTSWLVASGILFDKMKGNQDGAPQPEPLPGLGSGPAAVADPQVSPVLWLPDPECSASPSLMAGARGPEPPPSLSALGKPPGQG